MWVNKKIIKYVCFYTVGDDQEDRYCNAASATKLEYIFNALNRMGYSIDIISASYTQNPHRCFAGSCRKLRENRTLRLFFTMPRSNFFLKILSVFTMNFFIFLELLKTRKNEIVIVYHSLRLMRLVKIAHVIKRFRLIYEVEEVYSDVIGKKIMRDREIKLLGDADAYVFPTKLLNEVININKKPYVIIYGTYNLEQKRKIRVFSDNKIHCVYAGNLDPRKGGAAAAAAAAYLSDHYHIHIIGTGSPENRKIITDIIEETRGKNNAIVTYDGGYTGEDYISFVQSCDIGLCTQNIDAEFNATSFPSKILSYLCNGLRVISIDIPAIRESPMANILYFCKDASPFEIAKTISAIDIDDECYDSRKIIKKLSDDFEQKLDDLIKKL